jgi:hypothetical protein
VPGLWKPMLTGCRCRPGRDRRLAGILPSDADDTQPAGFALCLGTVLVLMFARSGSLAGRLLSFPPLVGVGLISYSVYIWHQPLLAFLRVRMLNEPSIWLCLAVALMSLPIGWLSWRYIEKPFRNRNTTSRRMIFAGSVALSAVIFAIGAAGQLRQGFPDRLPDQASTWQGIFNEESALFQPCLSSEQHYLEPQDSCVRNKALAGNRHALRRQPWRGNGT